MTLESERLIIRELIPDDLEFMTEMLADEDVMRFWPRPLDRSEAETWIVSHRERYSHHGFGYWIAISKATGHPVGQVGLLMQEFDGRDHLGLGYMFHRPYWGQGYAYEGSRRCLKYAFEELEANEVIALIQAANEPSRRLAGRLGFVITGQTIYKDFLHGIHTLDRIASLRNELA